MAILAIVGPTAVGKSGLALELAEASGAEIVSCDSVQVYRGFNIGCAKATAEEQGRVQHHLIDVVQWDEAFDAQRYCQLADAAIATIQRSNKPVILCGGTGLYLRALRWGMGNVPPSDPVVRERLVAQERAEPGSTFARLCEVDPVGAGQVQASNLVHVTRALEIYELTGTPASALRDSYSGATARLDIRVVVLQRDLEDLRRRMAARVEQMLAEGLLDEVRGLLAAGVPADCRPMMSVGYREASTALASGDSGDLVEKILVSTWRYGKRQRTWFRKERQVEYLDASTVDRNSLLAGLG